MPKRKLSHTHQYYKHYLGGVGVGHLANRRTQWTCGLPDCTHYLPGNMKEPVGKLSLCNQCMEVFVLDEDNMKNDKPICISCANPNDISIPDGFDWERAETRSYIATKTGRVMSDITEAEIERTIQLRRLSKM